jgi:tRNA-2-methylthio-N6-dimethylallyladenosine synthase
MSEPAPRYRIETWGCAMNFHDSEKLAGLLEEMGCRPAEPGRDPDVILLNTCSIREKAEEKIFSRLGALRALKRRNPDLVVGVCGCVAQQEGEAIFRRSSLVDLVLGPRAISSLPTLIQRVRRERIRPLDLGRRDDSIRFEGARARRAPGPRASITVMEGCNKTCTYCIVPTTRGREISKPADLVLREAGELARTGYREVELLGQNVNAYRDPDGVRLDGLLRRLQRVEAIERVRFSTSHPAHLSLDIIRAMAECPTVCGHLHLPAQSGSDAILERMRRGYTRLRYLDRIASLRRHVPGIALSTDIIVGYPGETDAEFRETLSLLREVEFDQVYSFLYSPRPGTEAEREPDGVPHEAKQARHAELQQVQAEIQLRRNRAQVGSVVEVLVDGSSRKGGGQLRGRTRSNRIVNFAGEPELVGEFVLVRVEHATPQSLEGTPVARPGLDLVGTAGYK